MIRKIHNSNNLSCPLGGQITEVLLHCYDCIYSIIGHFITVALILCFLLHKGKLVSESTKHKTLLRRQMEGGGGGGGAV